MKNWQGWWSRPVWLLLLFGLALVLAIWPWTATPASQSPAHSSPTVEVFAGGNSSLEKGLQLYQAGNLVEAVQVWETLLTTLTAADPQRIDVLNYLALAYHRLGRWEQAMKSIATSLTLIQQTSDSATKMAQLAVALNTQGRLQFAVGQAEAALESWKAATQIYQQLKDLEGTIGSLLNQAQTQQYLGFYIQALQTLQTLEATLQGQPDSRLKVTGLRSLGNAWRLAGESEKSLQVLEQALTIARQLKDQPALASVLLTRGNTALALDKKGEALRFYEQAAKAYPSSATQINADLNRLNLLIENTSNYDAALTLGRSLLQQVASLPPSRTTTTARVNLGRRFLRLAIKFEKNDPTSQRAIVQLLAETATQAKKLQDPQGESYALGILGGFYEVNQQWQDAKTLTQQALLLAQSVNATDVSYLWQWQLGRLFEKTGQSSRAAGSYSEAIASLQALRTDLAAVSQDLQFSFRDSVEPIYREYVEILLSDKVDGNPEDNLTKARNAIESLQLAELENFFGQACLQGTPVQIDQVDLRAAVVYPIILPDRLEVILSLPGEPLRHYAAPVTAKRVEQTATSFREQLNYKNDVKPLANEIYNWLIRPARNDLQRLGVKTLVFVLDGKLRNIPMSALYDGQQYLVQTYGIALAPGLQLLDVKPLSREQLQVLPVGLTEARQGFSPLPSVGKEIEEITKIGKIGNVLVNESFTKQNLEAAIDTFKGPIVHLATHGEFSSKAENTFLLTWDGKLTINELGRLLSTSQLIRQRPIELLVLSACRTALGDNRAALGLSGMALRAGARSTIGTLWYVDDTATSTVMADFYQEYSQPAITKAEALRLAQLKLLETAEHDHPYFWAPFILVGNWL